MIWRIILPLLFFTSVHAQKQFNYSWERYGLSFKSSIIMNEMSDEDYWDVDDDSLDLNVEVTRTSFDAFTNEELNMTIKNFTYLQADSLSIGKVKDGGVLQGIKEGYFVYMKDDGFKSYYAVIIDRSNKAVFELEIYDYLERKSIIYEIIRSIEFHP